MESENEKRAREFGNSPLWQERAMAAEARLHTAGDVTQRWGIHNRPGCEVRIVKKADKFTVEIDFLRKEDIDHHIQSGRGWDDKVFGIVVGLADVR